jgi:hypothetical protein
VEGAGFSSSFFGFARLELLEGEGGGAVAFRGQNLDFAHLGLFGRGRWKGERKRGIVFRRQIIIFPRLSLGGRY